MVQVLDHNNNTIDIISKHIILATGAHPRNLPNIHFDDNIVWNAKNAMTPTTLPKSLAIIGTGAIGIEFASFYNTFGTQVTMIELRDNILPLEDYEVSELMQHILSQKGIKIYTKSSVTKLEKFNNNARIQISNTIDLEVDKVILAVGIQPNTDDLGLNNTKVQTDKTGFIITDKYCCTSELGIYAIGDVAGPPCLAQS